MRAIKLTGYIGSNHRLELDLPEDMPEGSAEVIVLIPESSSDTPHDPRRYLEDFFRDLDTSDRPHLSSEDIDRYLENERAGWDFP